MEWLFTASAWVVPVVLAITLHEVSHGWMAEKFGDPTARALGRITLNPFKHIDRFGTLILPAILVITRAPVVFGYAKPVPVNFHRLSPPMLGMFTVALAGPGMNVMLAIASGLLLHLVPESSWLGQNLDNALMINCVLAVFNMIPILPLDGGRVVYAVLPGELRRAYGRTERFGMAALALLLLIPPLLGMNLLQDVLTAPVSWLIDRIAELTGNSG